MTEFALLNIASHSFFAPARLPLHEWKRSRPNFARNRQSMAKQLDADQSSLFDKVYADYKEFVNPPLARFMKLAGAPVEERAQGCRVFDTNGKSYLDFCGGYGVFTLGHSHPKVVAAVKKQLDKMSLSTRVFFNEQMGALARELAEVAPGDLQISFFSDR